MKNLSEKHVLPTKLLIKLPEEVERRSAGGLIIPGTAGKITSSGTVVIAGSGTDKLPMPVSVGQTVMFPPSAGIKVKFEDEDFFLINISDVLLFW
jgi:chaperonin GroES